MSAIVTFCSLLVLIVYIWLHKSNISNEEVEIQIPEKTGISKIVEICNDEGYLKPTLFFELYLKFYSFKSGRSIIPGYYSISNKTSNLELVRILFSNEIKTKNVTIPEGSNIFKIASILQSKVDIDSTLFIKYCFDDSLLKAKEIKSKSFEGYLFPSTYNFSFRTDERKILMRLFKTQQNLWEKYFEHELTPMSLDKNQILTLASIVEAETPLKSEAPIVAGLYLNRLRRGMILQSDPTVQYALGNKKKLTREDLEVNSPYNTYINNGLPPGPINNPGIEAIRSVFEYKKHNFIYMVAVGDNSGKHNFSETLEKHNQYVREYRNRRNNR